MRAQIELDLEEGQSWAVPSAAAALRAAGVTGIDLTLLKHYGAFLADVHSVEAVRALPFVLSVEVVADDLAEVPEFRVPTVSELMDIVRRRDFAEMSEAMQLLNALPEDYVSGLPERQRLGFGLVVSDLFSALQVARRA